MQAHDVTLRPGWLESRAEQVVLLDWPLLPAVMIQELASLVAAAPLSPCLDNTTRTGLLLRIVRGKVLLEPEYKQGLRVLLLPVMLGSQGLPRHLRL